MSDQKYTPFNIYQKRKMSESATPLKSIYAKNHNMFMNAVPDLRDGMDRGFETGGGEKKKPLPTITPNNNDDKNKKSKLSVDLSGKTEENN